MTFVGGLCLTIYSPGWQLCRGFEFKPFLHATLTRPPNNLFFVDMGAYVQLLEYNNIEGMVLLSELSRRRIRSINKLIKVREA